MANPLPVIIHQDEVGIKEAIVDLKGSLRGLTFQIATNTKDTRDHLGAIATRMLQIVDAVKTEDPGTDLVPVDEDTGPGTDVVPVDGEPVEDEFKTDAIRLMEEIAMNTRATAFATAKVYEAIKMQGSEDAENVLDPDATTPLIGQPTDTGGGDDKGDDAKKAKTGFFDMIAILFGTIIGSIGGIVGGFVKAFKLVIVGPIKALGGQLAKLFPKTFAKISGVFSRIGQTFANIGKSISNVAKNVKTFVMKPFAKIGQFFSKIGKSAAGGSKVIGAIVKKVGSMFNIFKKVGSFFGKIAKVAGMVARVVGKIFLPLTVFFAGLETIKGAFEGFTKTEGSLIDKIIGGVMGAIGGLFDFFISWPINLVKNLISWIAGALGFDGIKEKLDAFEFSFDFLINGITGFVTGIGKWIGNQLAKVGIPPFRKTFFEGTWAEKSFTFGGWYPFAGLASKEEVEEPGPGEKPPSGDAQGSDQAKGSSDAMKLKIPGTGIETEFHPLEVDGKKYLVSDMKSKDGKGFIAMNDKGGLVKLEDPNGTVATMLEAAKSDAGAMEGGSTSGGDISGATGEMNQATEAASGGGGSSTAISAPVTTVGGSTTSVSTTNVNNSSADNSLKTRQQKYSW